MNIAQLRGKFGFLQEFTDEEVARYIIAAHGVQSEKDPRFAPMEQELLGYDRTLGEKVKDAGLGLVQGALGLAQTGAVIQAAPIPGVRAYDNPVYNKLGEFQTDLDKYKSTGLRNQELGADVAGDIAVRQAAGEGAGLVGRFVAGAKAQAGQYLENPGLAIQDTAQSLPSLAAGGVIGRGLQAGAGLVGLGAKAAARVGTAGAIGSSAALQGGDVATDAYARARAAGATYEQAAAAATEAGVKGGAVSLGLTLMPGGATIERSMIRGAGGRGGVVGAVRGGAAELSSEAGEEGYGQYAGNQAVQTFNPNQDLAQGVGRAAVQAGVGALGPGAFAGHHGQAQVVQPPRTETGEINLSGSDQFAGYDTPTYVRQGQDPLNERSSPYAPPSVIQEQERTRGLAQPGVPGYLQSDQNIPAFLRAEPTAADIAGPAIDPMQRTPANFADLYAEQTPNPYDTSGFSGAPTTAPGAGPGTATPAPAASPQTQAGATDFTTSPGAAPARGNNTEFSRDVDTSGLSLQEPGQTPAAAPVNQTKPTVGNLLVALEKANASLGKNVIRKDGQLSQASGTAALRTVLEAKDPIAAMHDLYQDGKNVRDELLDVWHKELTGQTIAETKGEPAPEAAPNNSAGFVPEPPEQIKTQLQALREGRINTVVLGKEEAATADLKGLKAQTVSDSSGATGIVVSRDGKPGQQAAKRVQEVGLKQALGEAKGVVDPTITSMPAPPSEGAVTVQQVDNKTGHVLHEEVARPGDVSKVKKVRGTTQRVVPVDQAMQERRQAAAEAPAAAPAEAPAESSVQHLEPKKPSVAERKISARVEGSAAAMDGAGRGANPYKLGTASHREWVEGHDEVKARAEAAKENPVAKKLVEAVENTKDESLYDESLFALYKLAANGDVVAYNYFHSNGYYNERNEQGAPEKLKPAQRAEMTKLRTRWETEQAQRRGKAFGASTKDVLTQIVEAQDETPNLRRRSLLVGLAGFLANGTARAGTTLGRAKPVNPAVLHQALPANVAKILRGNGATNIEGAKAIKQALQLIVATGPADVRELAAKIAKLMPSDGLMLTVDDKSLSNAHGAVELSPVAHLTLFTAQGRTGMTYETFLHEALHATVAARYRSLSLGLLRENDAKMGMSAPQAAKAMEQFRAVWDEFRSIAPKGETGKLKLSLGQAAGDPDEFFVRALTDPTLQAWMAGQEYKGKTLWERFKDWVKTSLLGFKSEGTTPSWLDAALVATTDLVDAMSGDPGDNKRLRAVNSLSSERSVKESAMEDKAPVKALAAGARALTATVRAQMKGEELNESLLNMMTLRQVDEQFGKKLPALRDWVNVVMERSTNASKLAAEADRVALQWQQDVPRNEQKSLAEILLRASNAELQLDNTSPKYVNELSAEERTEYNELRRKLEALTPAAKQARKEALAVLSRQWEYTRDALKKFITLTVSDPGLRQARLEDLEAEFGRNHGDYFPLSRFGDRVVIARGAAKDGRDVVTFHESTKAVDEEIRRLKDSGVKPDSIIVTMSTEYDPKKVPGTGFVRELHGMIDNIASGEEAQQLHQTLQQLYLKSLPEMSGAKHMVRREHIEGFSQDALRSFADAVTRGSRYASHLEFGPAVHAAMESAEAQSRSSDRRTAAVVIGRKEGQQPLVKVVGTGTERLQTVEKMAEDGYAVEFFNAHPETVAERLAGALEKATPEELAKHVMEVRAAVKNQGEGVEDLRAAKQLYNYMVRSQKADLNPNTNKVIELAGQVGYAWYLGFSPAFWAMNTLQNPMVGIPHLGGKYGVGKASTEWMRAAKWFASVRIGKRLAKQSAPFSIEWLREQVNAGELKGINKQELDMLQRLEDRQVLDFTQAMDLSRIGSASNSVWYKAMRLAAAGAHHTEVFNRVSFALAAYRLAMKSRPDMTHDEATRAAERDVASAHFDYSYANKPLWMGKSNPALRLVFMFQQYRQHMLYWWANTVKEATKGESKEVRMAARKSALLMGTTQLLFAGTMGLPFIGAVSTLANMLGGGGDDGEEPFDFERWLREAAVGMTGSEAGADLVLKGIFAALGADISKRIGQSDLLPLLNPGSARFERDFDDKTRAYLFDMLGPLGSIALGASRATEAFAAGDYMRGLQATTPKAVSDILRSYQQASEGLKDKRGQHLATEEAFDGWDAAFQAAGITPTAVSNAKQARGAVLDIQNSFKDQSKRLTGSFVESWMRGDQEGVKAALADIQHYNRNVAKGKMAQRSLLITPDRLKSGIVERQRRGMLLALTGGLADTRQQLLIATRVSGLYDLEGRDARLDGAGLPALPTFGGGASAEPE